MARPLPARLSRSYAAAYLGVSENELTSAVEGHRRLLGDDGCLSRQAARGALLAMAARRLSHVRRHDGRGQGRGRALTRWEACAYLGVPDDQLDELVRSCFRRFAPDGRIPQLTAQHVLLSAASQRLFALRRSERASQLAAA